MTKIYTKQALPAKLMALPQAMLPKATTVVFGDSNTTPKTLRKRFRTQRLTRPYTNNPSNHDQDLNF